MKWLTSVTLSLALLALVAGPARAADTAGRFSVKGVGTATCQTYLDTAHNKDRELLLFAGYLGGYVTAYNQLSGDTFDILPWQTVETLLGLLDNYCRKHPEANYAAAVSQLMVVLKADRLPAASETVDARTETGAVTLYRETLQRTQQRLGELGDPTAVVSDTFDEPTRQALIRYQHDHELPETGLPDQRTLFRLLFKPSPGE